MDRPICLGVGLGRVARAMKVKTAVGRLQRTNLWRRQSDCIVEVLNISLTPPPDHRRWFYLLACAGVKILAHDT